MSFNNVLSLVGGLCLFLFGMQFMGSSLEKSAGSKLRGLIGKLTSNKLMGFLTGLGVTAVIQSSSATTVMVVGFVNSGIMKLTQAINVIMGANVGTTVTSWILSLSGISSDNPIVSLFKPSTFTPILALFGIILFMFSKSDKRKDIGAILLGFSTLMFGMETMSGAVSGLGDIPEFGTLLLKFSNPLLGVLAGAILTAVLQSSSASMGILQALTVTGQVTIGTAIPIILGQNIGTCITAMLSSVGATKNAKRAAVVHLSFNLIGSMIFLGVFELLKAIFDFAFVNDSASAVSIAIVHSIFNVSCTLCMLPLGKLLEKISIKLVPDGKFEDEEEVKPALDERLFVTPSFAIESCQDMSNDMADCALKAFTLSLDALENYSPEKAEKIKKYEKKADIYEDTLGSYLVKLSAKALNITDSNEANKILHIIGDFERISDHAVNIMESGAEINSKKVSFTEDAKKELDILISAVNEIVKTTFESYKTNNLELALSIEPLEQVIDDIKEQIRSRHIYRLQAGNCTLDVGFVLSDLLTNLERIADHCSNIAGCIIEMRHDDLDLHKYLDDLKKKDGVFSREYEKMQRKYYLPNN